MCYLHQTSQYINLFRNTYTSSNTVHQSLQEYINLIKYSTSISSGMHQPHQIQYINLFRNTSTSSYTYISSRKHPPHQVHTSLQKYIHLIKYIHFFKIHPPHQIHTFLQKYTRLIKTYVTKTLLQSLHLKLKMQKINLIKLHISCITLTAELQTDSAQPISI